MYTPLIWICARANLDRGYNGQSIAIMSNSQAAIQEPSSPVIWSTMVLGVPSETELAWEKHQSYPPLGAWTHWCRRDRIGRWATRKGTSTPQVGPEPFCGLEMLSSMRKWKQWLLSREVDSGEKQKYDQGFKVNNLQRILFKTFYARRMIATTAERGRATSPSLPTRVQELALAAAVFGGQLK